MNNYCGICGFLETPLTKPGDGGICPKCNQDDWIQIEDFEEESLLSHIKEVAIKFKTTPEKIKELLLKKENYPSKEEILIKFEGIDRFNRPIFKSLKTKSRYGSVDILFGYNATEKEVLEKISEKDLLWFGNSFGCEPMGDPTKNLIIIRSL